MYVDKIKRQNLFNVDQNIQKESMTGFDENIRRDSFIS